MHPRPILLNILLLSLALLPASGHASGVVPSDFDSLVARSDYVVHAVVAAVDAEWRATDAGRHIASKVTLQVREVIHGSPPSPLVLDMIGGRVGRDELTVVGAPKFRVGEESILFVHGNGRQIVPLVNMQHGHYPVRRDPRTGETQVMRSSGRLLYDEREVALPETAVSSAPTRDPEARPMTTAEFAARIRHSAKGPDREQLK